VVDREVRQAMEKDIELTQLEDMVKRKGFRNMYDVAVIKVQQGATTVEEIQRVLGKTRY
jgi:general secretion pathway protein E/type IV pilus assembly protein PilB